MALLGSDMLVCMIKHNENFMLLVYEWSMNTCRGSGIYILGGGATRYASSRGHGDELPVRILWE
jgi:hypothetical protein